MRSPDSPRVLHDATVELASGARGRSVNLSTSGILVSAEEKLPPGEQVRLKVNLHDGANPLDVGAQVVRAGNDGMALRFTDLDDMAKQRIQRVIQKREPTGVNKHDVRIHLPSLSSPLRAMAREHDERGVMIEADLPWLRLGSPVTAELSEDRAVDGHVTWIGLDVTRAGAARLRIFVDFSGDENAMTPPPEELLKKHNLPAPALNVSNRTGSQVALSSPSPSLPRRNLVWPAIAITALVAVAALGTALSLRPPAAALLPTAPPEREAEVVKLPARTVVPKETSEAVAAASDGAELPSAIAVPFGPPLVVAKATPSPAANAAVAHAGGRAVKKKHARAKRRAD